MPKTKAQPTNLKVTVDPAVTEMLTEPLRDLVQKVLDVLYQEKEKGVPMKGIHLYTFTDPEAEDWTEIIFGISFTAGPDEAMRYRQRLSTHVRSIRDKLDDTQRELLDMRLGIHVSREN